MLETLLIISLTLIPSVSSEVIDLSLEDAKLMALEQNRAIQLQKQNIVIAEGEVTSQKGTFDPVFDFTTAYTDSQTATVSTFVESGSIDQQVLNMESGLSGRLPTGTFYDVLNFTVTRTETNSPVESLSPNVYANLGFSIGQDILKNFGTDINTTFIRAARRDKDISYEEFERTVADVIVEVESDYWLLVAARQNLELEKKALDLALDLLERNRTQVETGVLPPVAITQAEAEVAARKVDLISAENRLQRAQDRLKNRILLPMDKEVNPVDSPRDVEITVDEQRSLESAYEHRPELRRAKIEINKSEQLMRYYSNQRLPTLSVEASVEFEGVGGDPNPDRLIFSETPPPVPGKFDEQSDAFRNVYEGEFPSWTILGTFSYPIFNNKAKGDYIKAKATHNRNIIELKRVKEEIQLEIRNAIREVVNSKRSVDAANTSVRLAREVLGNENEKYKVGLATTRDILEAQRDLIDAETGMINAITEFNIALARLQRARGTILESSNIVLEQR